jgi:hypothetical protein
MTTPKTRTVLRVFTLIGVAFLAWVAFQPAPGRLNISAKLLGYTNDPSGARLAMIAVTNLGSSPVYVYRPSILIPAPTEPRGFAYYPGNQIQWHSELGGGASGSFTIPPPTNQSAWKLSFLVYNDLGAAQMIKRFVAGRHMPSEIESGWIDDEK